MREKKSACSVSRSLVCLSINSSDKTNHKKYVETRKLLPDWGYFFSYKRGFVFVFVFFLAFSHKPIKACLERLFSVHVDFRPFFNISNMFFFTRYDFTCLDQVLGMFMKLYL